MVIRNDHGIRNPYKICNGIGCMLVTKTPPKMSKMISDARTVSRILYIISSLEVASFEFS